MRPSRLTIEGINSFIEPQTVDFEAAGADNLFCISGSTGSGKTTIIDSIILALYPKHGERGNQIIAYEIERVELTEEDARPSNLELRVPACEFSQTRIQQLNRILQSYPGRDCVVLFVQQSDGRKFRAELPVSVDSRNSIMRSEIQDLFGHPVW